MGQIRDLIEVIRATPGCTVFPPSGQPTVLPSQLLPPDLCEFYDLAGGATLFNNDGWANRIARPTDFVQADIAVYGKLLDPGPEAAWYAIADVQDGDYLLIDLAPSRAGWCYDCFHETYREPGYMNVVASSFTEMLERLLKHGSNGSYWLSEEFHSTRDAYDGITRGKA